MGRRKGLLSGSALSDQSKLNRDLPLTGPKEFKPTNSWLEKKQVEKTLDEHFDLIKDERIERLNNISTAEWCPAQKKARVIKKTGKWSDTLGHHSNNEEWLFPEEALHLLETNCLELYYGGVRLSLERSYLLLLEDCNKCTLQEYLTYSHLSRQGYKVLRHSPDIKLTRYEKEIQMDNVLKQLKRSSEALDDLPSTTTDVICEVASVSNESVTDNNESEADKTDVIIDSKTEPSLASPKSDVIIVSPVENIITIDDDEDAPCSSEVRNCDSDTEDIIFVGISKQNANSRSWFCRKNQFLLSTNDAIDLSDDETKSELNSSVGGENSSAEKDVHKADLISKPRREVFKTFPSAREGAHFIRCPDLRLLPKSILPRHTEYRVNLNIRDTPPHNNALQRTYDYRPSYQRRNYHDNMLVRQVQEMRNMVFGMVQATTTLMSAFQSSQSQNLNLNNWNLTNMVNNQFKNLVERFSGSLGNISPRPLMGDQFGSRPYNPNYYANQQNKWSSNWFQRQHTQFGYRPYYRRGNRYRYRGQSRYQPKRTIHIINIDSDDDNDDDIIFVKEISNKRVNSGNECKPVKKYKTDSDLKPEVTDESDSQYHDDGDTLRKVDELKADIKGDEDIDAKEESSQEAAVIDVESWADFKLNPDKRQQNDDREDVKPIIDPQEHTTLEQVLSALQIFEMHTDGSSGVLKISFDVYQPSSNFKKSMKMLPNFRVIVLEGSMCFPSSSEMSKLKNVYADDIPFLVSAVCDDEVSFYNYDIVSIPTIM